jgi:hypothetical protein
MRQQLLSSSMSMCSMCTVQTRTLRKHNALLPTCILFRSGAAVLQTGHMYLAWPTAPPLRSCRPAFPPPMFVVAACTFALISAAVCLAGFAFPMMKMEASPSSDLLCRGCAQLNALSRPKPELLNIYTSETPPAKGRASTSNGWRRVFRRPCHDSSGCRWSSAAVIPVLKCYSAIRLSCLRSFVRAARSKVESFACLSRCSSLVTGAFAFESNTFACKYGVENPASHLHRSFVLQCRFGPLAAIQVPCASGMECY